MRKSAKSQYIGQINGNITQFNVEIAIICENMCEEGSQLKFGSEEGVYVFRTLLNAAIVFIVCWK